MSKINEIQAAILALDGGAYQKLLDQYLHRKYHFTNIHPLGIQNATNKTTKGIPDTYVIEDDKYILICHGTVSEQPVKKIKNDITACLDKAKACLDESKIIKIICCYTSSNITPKQCEDLDKIGGNIEVELISLGTLSHDLANRYRTLAADHLQIKLDTHQIYEIEDFISNYDKSGTNAPINTRFCLRNAELERVIETIINNNITVLSGPSGIGKTRLALEACRSFEKDGWKIYCVRSNGVLLYDDIEDYLDENEKYLLFFDDANTVTQLGNVLEECFSLNKPSQIKIILTVRDYAKEKVILETKKYTNSEEVSLVELNDETIRSILQDNFNINNFEFLEKICRISKGNARLAVLAGIRSTKSGLLAISNAEDIFKSYYNPIINEIGIDKQELILLGIISLFGAVNTNENSFYDNLTEKYLGKKNNNDEIEKLYEFELVDWYEREVVRVSDQSLGNYVLYLIFCEKKWIELSDLIELCVPQRTKLIVNLIDMLLSTFSSPDLSSDISNSVNKAWENAGVELQDTYVKTFFPLNPLKGLIYLKNYVENTTAKEYDIRNINFERSKNSIFIDTKEIDMLSEYRYTEHFEDAVSLLFVLYEKKPELFMDFYFAITRNLLFDKINYRRGYSYEQRFLGLMWKRCKNGENYNFSILYLRIAEYALNTEYTYTESSNKKTYTFVRMGLPVTDELKALRKSVWEAIFSLYDNSDYHELAKAILLKNHINGLYDKDYKELCISDFNSLYPFLSKEIPLPFDKARVIGKYKNAFEQLDIKVDERFSILDTSKEYLIYSIFSRKHYRNCFSDDLEKKKRQRIRKLIKNYSLDEYDSFFKICNFLKEKNVGNSWDMKTGIETVFSILKTDLQKFPEVVKLYLSNDAPYNIHTANILKCLLKNYGYDYTKKLICESKEPIVINWYSDLLLCIPKKDVNEIIANDYFLLQRNEFIKPNGIVMPLFYTSKFLKYDKAFLDEMNDYLFTHTDNISCFFGNAHKEKTVNAICNYYAKKINTLIDLYFTCDYALFDCDHLLFWKIYDCSPELVWGKYISKLLEDKEIENHENTIFKSIWGMPEYFERIDYAYSRFIEKSTNTSNHIFSILFAHEANDPYENRKKEWIINRVRNNVDNVEYINSFFNIVMEIFPSWKTEIIVYYLKYNNSINDFKKIRLLSLTDGWIGSEIPNINRRIQSLLDIRNSLSGIEYIEHKIYLDELIKDEEQCRDIVKKKEYVEEFSV